MCVCFVFCFFLVGGGGGGGSEIQFKNSSSASVLYPNFKTVKTDTFHFTVLLLLAYFGISSNSTINQILTWTMGS